jgi:hypothetical protein
MSKPRTEIVDVLECGCNPGKAYASRSSFRNHFSSNRHKAWEKDRHADERAGVTVDVLSRRLEACRLHNRSLAERVRELEGALFASSNKRSVSEALKRKVAAGQRWRCRGCGDVLSHVFEVDHARPLWAGPTRRTTCRRCAGSATGRRPRRTGRGSAWRRGRIFFARKRKMSQFTVYVDTTPSDQVAEQPSSTTVIATEGETSPPTTESETYGQIAKRYQNADSVTKQLVRQDLEENIDRFSIFFWSDKCTEGVRKAISRNILDITMEQPEFTERVLEQFCENRESAICDSCTICLERLLSNEEGELLPTKTQTLECGHVFHEVCIQRWKIKGKKHVRIVAMRRQ